MIDIALRPAVLIEKFTSVQIARLGLSIQIIVIVALDLPDIDGIGIAAVLQHVLQMIFVKVFFEGLNGFFQMLKRLLFVAFLKDIRAYLTSGGRGSTQANKIRKQLLPLLPGKFDRLRSDVNLKIAEAFHR
jgi:hypothetical protein